MTETPATDRRQPTASHGQRVLLTGTGLEALAVACILHDAGHDVQRFAPGGVEVPALGGMALTPTTYDVLASHDVVDPESVSIRAIERRDLTTDGTIASTLDGDLRFTAPDVLARHLRAALPDHLAETAGEVHESTRPTSQTDAPLDVVLTDGERRAGDLLLGADGWLSETRQRVLPTVTPEYAGYVVWHGTIPEDALPSDLVARFADALTVSRGHGDLVAAMLVPGPDGGTTPGERRIHWEWYRSLPAREVGTVLTDRDGVGHDGAVPPGALQQRFVGELNESIADHAPAFRELVHATPDPGVQPVVDLAVPRAVVNRTVLVGDAAFATRQHIGAGVTKALQDAAALATALRRYDDVPRALADWAATQEHAGRQLVEQGRQTDLDHLVGQV